MCLAVTLANRPCTAKNQINLQFLNNVKADKIVISDLTGKIILEQTIGTKEVDISQITKSKENADFSNIEIVKAFRRLISLCKTQ